MSAAAPSLLPTPLRQAFEVAVARYTAGEPAVAALLFAGLLEHAPDHADARRLRGLALVRAGRAPEGLSDLARARRLAPRDPLGPLHYGIGLLEAGRNARAAAMFRRAAAMAPGSAAPWINLSAALLALGHIPAARAAARRGIKLAPGTAEPLCALGLAEIAAGRLPDARQAFAEALHADRSCADAWVNLVHVLVRAGEIALAFKAIDEGLAACPRHGALEAAGAGLMLLAGQQDAAMARLRAIIERDPDCVAARLNLANAHLLDDEADAALATLAGSAPPGRDGAHWRAHRALALLLLDRDREAEQELDAVAPPYGDAEILILWRRIQLARRAGRPEDAEVLAARLAALADGDGAALFDHRIIAHFDLARLRYGNGERDKAFDHWIAGHRLLQRSQPFSRADYAAFVDASIEAYGVERLRSGPRADNADAAPVFIVGLPRSGTTLAEQILAAHPLVHGAGERAAIHHLFTRLAAAGATSPHAVRRAAALDAHQLTHHASGFLADLHRLDPTAQRVVDKMPANALHLGFIATLLPGARIILCRRDPRDIGTSIFQLRFFGHHPYAHDLADLGWYIGQHERLIRHWQAALPLPILEVGLADWVDDFDATLARLLHFLDLPPDPACARFYEQDRRVRTASSRQVRQPVNARGLGRWRQHEARLAPMIAELEAAGLLEADARQPERSGATP